MIKIMMPLETMKYKRSKLLQKKKKNRRVQQWNKVMKSLTQVLQILKIKRRRRKIRMMNKVFKFCSIATKTLDQLRLLTKLKRKMKKLL